eukprot:g782.t1
MTGDGRWNCVMNPSKRFCFGLPPSSNFVNGPAIDPPLLPKILDGAPDWPPVPDPRYAPEPAKEWPDLTWLLYLVCSLAVVALLLGAFLLRRRRRLEEARRLNDAQEVEIGGAAQPGLCRGANAKWWGVFAFRIAEVTSRATSLALFQCVCRPWGIVTVMSADTVLVVTLAAISQMTRGRKYSRGGGRLLRHNLVYALPSSICFFLRQFVAVRTLLEAPVEMWHLRPFNVTQQVLRNRILGLDAGFKSRAWASEQRRIMAKIQRAPHRASYLQQAMLLSDLPEMSAAEWDARFLSAKVSYCLERNGRDWERK